jgi:hypothetical protein
MPGIPTHYKIIELTIEKLKSSSQPNLLQIAQVMENNLPYAYLGAIGSSLADFIPHGFPPIFPNSYMEVWKIVFDIVRDDPRAINAYSGPGLYTILRSMNQFLDKIEPIANNEDFEALKDMQSEANVIVESANNLKDLITYKAMSPK